MICSSAVLFELFVDPLSYIYSKLLFVLIAEMEQVYLISPDVDNTHRAKVLSERTLDPLLTRGPREHWQIHPQWEDRLLYITL